MSRSQAEEIEHYKDLILEGNMLAVDPSSRSLGYALFNRGALLTKGCKKYRGSTPSRLMSIYADMRELVTTYQIEFLAIERLRGTNGYSPPQLLWSVGALLAAVPYPFIEISPNSWKVSARELDLPKTDENDAYCIGHRVIQIAGG